MQVLVKIEKIRTVMTTSKAQIKVAEEMDVATGKTKEFVSNHLGDFAGSVVEYKFGGKVDNTHCRLITTLRENEITPKDKLILKICSLDENPENLGYSMQAIRAGKE